MPRPSFCPSSFVNLLKTLPLLRELRSCRLVKSAVRAGQERRRNGRRKVGDEAMLLLLPQFPLGSNYQLDELRRVLLRIDIASNAQLVADLKIRWVHISSQLVDRRGLLTRIDIQKTHSRCRLVHSSSRSRLGLLSTVHKNHIPKSPHSKPNISLLITLSSSGHCLLLSSGQCFYLADSPTRHGITSLNDW